jgi:hypothetical protein
MEVKIIKSEKVIVRINKQILKLIDPVHTPQAIVDDWIKKNIHMRIDPETGEVMPALNNKIK